MQKIKLRILTTFQRENIERTIKNVASRQTFQSGVAALITVGLLLWFDVKPLGLVFLIIYCIWLFKNQHKLHIGSSLQNQLHRLLECVTQFRENHRDVFCIIGSGFFLALAVVGHMISGSIMVLISFGITAYIYSHFIDNICRENERVESKEDFFPESDFEKYFTVETADLEDSENEDNISEEIPADFLMADSIPEIDEISTDDDQDDLLPIVQVSKSETHIQNSNPATDALVKYSQSNDAIEFKKGHFKRDSSLSTTSSSSEESLSKGLKFPDHTSIDGPKKSGSSTKPIRPDYFEKRKDSSWQEANDRNLAVSTHAQSLLANSSKIIPVLLSDLVQTALDMGSGALGKQNNRSQDPNPIPIDSSDESDFELLEQDDFQ